MFAFLLWSNLYLCVRTTSFYVYKTQILFLFGFCFFYQCLLPGWYNCVYMLCSFIYRGRDRAEKNKWRKKWVIFCVKELWNKCECSAKQFLHIFCIYLDEQNECVCMHRHIHFYSCRLLPIYNQVWSCLCSAAPTLRFFLLLSYFGVFLGLFSIYNIFLLVVFLVSYSYGSFYNC